MKKLIVLVFLVAMLMMTTSAMAIPISGEINFAGALTLVGGTDLLTASGIDFTNPALVVQSVTGIYAGIPAFPPSVTPVTFTNFAFAAMPVVPLWTLTYGGVTYDFDLSSVTQVSATEIRGLGVLGATGYDDTDGKWALTTQRTGPAIISFSSSSYPVPEPGSLMLLLTGFTSLAFFARRRRQ